MTVTATDRPIGSGIRSTLYGWITVDHTDDHEPPFPVELSHVPVIGARTAPIKGISLHYGKGDIPAILQRQIQDAEESGRQLYEVRAIVDVDQALPITALDVATIVNDQSVPVGDRRTRVIHLHRTKPEADEYLRELLRDDIQALTRDQGDMEIVDWRLSRIVSRYPHLLDALRDNPAMSHVIMFVWEGDVPGPAHSGHDVEGRVRNAKMATLYAPERIVELRTLNSDFAQAVLPPALQAQMTKAPEPVTATDLVHSGPGMGG